MGQEFTLRPYDKVRISSTGDRPISGDFSISPEGSLNLLGNKRIDLAGRSLDEASNEISRVLGWKVGRVGISLLGNVSGSASFRGAVRRSGTVNLRTPKTMADIFAIAEPTDSADLNGIIVISSQAKTFRVDYETNPKFSIRSGDQILIPQLSKANEVLVLGAVNKPGSMKFIANQTLEQWVVQAGGLTGHAIPTQIAVLRDGDVLPGADWTDAGRKVVLKRADVIRVPSVENGRYVSVLGHVKTPGLVPFKPGMTMMEAIASAGGTTVGAGLDSVEVRKVFGGQGKNRKFDLNLIKLKSPNDPKLQAADIVFVPAFVFKAPSSGTGFKPVVPPRRLP